MGLTQNETSSELRVSRRAAPVLAIRPSSTRNSQLATRAFTLTELLVVVTIIAILAGLITGAAVNALNKAKQARITLEAQQLSNAMADFKNDFGAYPPNVFEEDSISSSSADQARNASQLLRFLRKAFGRSTEFNTSANVNSAANNIATIGLEGLSPAEALVFWLQGFSTDPARPLSGTDLVVTQIDDNGMLEPDVITIDQYQPRFDFDKGRLRLSRNEDDDRRFLTVHRADVNETEVYIQLYEYLPAGSNEPYVYFDTSRETPEQVANNWETTEFFYSSPQADAGDPQVIYPLKRLKENAPPQAQMSPTRLGFVEYVQQGKFQILHCGLDDIWGNFSSFGGELNLNVSTDEIPNLLFPDGPFIGDIADTVGSFLTGTLEDEQE